MPTVPVDHRHRMFASALATTLATAVLSAVGVIAANGDTIFYVGGVLLLLSALVHQILAPVVNFVWRAGRLIDVVEGIEEWKQDVDANVESVQNDVSAIARHLNI